MLSERKRARDVRCRLRETSGNRASLTRYRSCYKPFTLFILCSIELFVSVNTLCIRDVQAVWRKEFETQFEFCTRLDIRFCLDNFYTFRSPSASAFNSVP